MLIKERRWIRTMVLMAILGELGAEFFRFLENAQAKL